MGSYLSIFPLPKPVTGIDHFRPSPDDREERTFANDLGDMYIQWAMRKGIEVRRKEDAFNAPLNSWDGVRYSTFPKTVLFFPIWMANMVLKGEEGVHGIRRKSCFDFRVGNFFVGVTVAPDLPSFRSFDHERDMVRFHYFSCPSNWTAVYKDGKRLDQTFGLLLETCDLDTFLELRENNVQSNS